MSKIKYTRGGGGINYRLRVQNLFNRRDEYRFNLFTLASVYTLYADHSHNHNIYTEAPPFLAKVYGVALVIRDPRFSNNVPTRSKIQLSLSTNEFFLLTRSSKRKEKKWKKRIRIIDRSVLRVRFSPRFLRNRKNFFKESPRFVCIPFLNTTRVRVYIAVSRAFTSWSNNLKRIVSSNHKLISILGARAREKKKKREERKESRKMGSRFSFF